MCCFSREVQEVKNTRIFGRVSSQGNQCLIYQMALGADEEVAMILPVPVRSGLGDNAVTFLNLRKYPGIFADLHQGFPKSSTTYGTDPRCLYVNGRYIDEHMMVRFLDKAPGK